MASAGTGTEVAAWFFAAFVASSNGGAISGVLWLCTLSFRVSLEAFFTDANSVGIAGFVFVTASTNRNTAIPFITAFIGNIDRFISLSANTLVNVTDSVVTAAIGKISASSANTFTLFQFITWSAFANIVSAFTELIRTTSGAALIIGTRVRADTFVTPIKQSADLSFATFGLAAFRFLRRAF